MDPLDDGTTRARAPSCKPPRHRNRRAAQAPSPEPAPAVVVHCIFYLYNPRTNVACADLEYSRARDMKPHLREHHHRPPHYCPTCNQIFKAEGELLSHQLKATCAPPDNGSQIQGLDANQLAQLNALRAKSHQDIAETVGEYWDISFPGTARPGSFVKVKRTKWEEDVAGMRGCWAVRRPDIVPAIHGTLARWLWAVPGIDVVRAVADVAVGALFSAYVDPGAPVDEPIAELIAAAFDPWKLAAGPAAEASNFNAHGQWPGSDEPQLFGGLSYADGEFEFDAHLDREGRYRVDAVPPPTDVAMDTDPDLGPDLDSDLNRNLDFDLISQSHQYPPVPSSGAQSDM
ncbi:hypothetical protein C8A05DRAFT_35801 [Staphylotrichum tortipilum]|uniref:C2H2-type domain-containing protein n=1 Tax=Staphylotrichum tortipilum TaxID=2831512 RepID=A0AAN6MI48_9PEZI|nr:hypothetical protein C8A05DRAFT_35801 [Staphylotrichum longicolle]